MMTMNLLPVATVNIPTTYPLRVLKWGLLQKSIYFPGYEESSLQDDSDRPNLTDNKHSRAIPGVPAGLTLITGASLPYSYIRLQAASL